MKIRDSEINLEVFKEDIEHFKTLNWSFSKWKGTPAIKDKSGTTSKYYGQNYNPNQWDYIDDGWSHDDCEICIMSLFNSHFAFESYGYRNEEEDWLCYECYSKLIENNFKETKYVLKEKFQLSNNKSILFVSPILDKQQLKISNNSKFGNFKLEHYLDKPRKLLSNGELDDNTFAIMLKDKDDLNKLKLDELYEITNV